MHDFVMTSPEIIYLESSGAFKDTRLLDFVQQYPQVEWDNVVNTSKMMPAYGYVLCPRAGKQNFPFKNKISNYINMDMPMFDPGYTESFSSVTDRRCIELLKEKNDRPWLIFWSGGIDSTTVLTSVLKNTTVEDRKNIQVVCNRISVYENPRFFYNHIEKNFNLIDTSEIYGNSSLDIFKKYYVLNGEFNDQLSVGRGAEFLRIGSDIGLKDCTRDPDQLLESLAKTLGSESACWYYERMIENIQSTDLPITTYFDFCWWQFFNYVWTTLHIDRYSRYVRRHTHSLENFKLYDLSTVNWFNSEEYQQWSMYNMLVNRDYGNSVASGKQYAKEYIYEFDHDEYYRLFKTKTPSISWEILLKANPTPTPFCYLDDFTCLTLDNDLDQILNLLPDYLNL
jgi:hypothetical protein